MLLSLRSSRPSSNLTYPLSDLVTPTLLLSLGNHALHERLVTEPRVVLLTLLKSVIVRVNLEFLVLLLCLLTGQCLGVHQLGDYSFIFLRVSKDVKGGGGTSARCSLTHQAKARNKCNDLVQYCSDNNEV